MSRTALSKTSETIIETTSREGLYLLSILLPLVLQADAEEICTILQQAFQLVFTEATMEHLNNSISAGARESVFLPAPVPQSQPPHADHSRGSRPQKRKQPQATAMVVPVPEGSSDSEGKQQ